MKKHRVLGNRVLIQRDPEEAPSHILMPNNVRKKPKSGIVLNIGPKVDEDLVEGNRVYFNEYAGSYLETSTDLVESDLLVLRQDEILTVEYEVEILTVEYGVETESNA